MSFDTDCERLERLNGQAEPIAEGLTELCLGRPIDVALQALGLAMSDALRREHPLSSEEMELVSWVAHADLERLISEAARPSREGVLGVIYVLALKITLLSGMVNSERFR